jgi:hypothetical protein
MEELVAGAVAPLSKVIEMVDRSEAYVGLFAWSGPAAPDPDAWKPPDIPGARYGETSITHYEYIRAVQRKLPIIAILLDEQHPWPPQLIDGFDRTRSNAVDSIRTLREALQTQRVVSWFTSPSDLRWGCPGRIIFSSRGWTVS